MWIHPEPCQAISTLVSVFPFLSCTISMQSSLLTIFLKESNLTKQCVVFQCFRTGWLSHEEETTFCPSKAFHPPVAELLSEPIYWPFDPTPKAPILLLSQGRKLRITQTTYFTTSLHQLVTQSCVIFSEHCSRLWSLPFLAAFSSDHRNSCLSASILSPSLTHSSPLSSLTELQFGSGWMYFSKNICLLSLPCSLNHLIPQFWSMRCR